MGPFVLIPCSNHFLRISRNLPGFLRVSQVLFLREKNTKNTPQISWKKTSTKLLQVDLHAKHPLGAPLKIWTSIEINIDDGSNGQTLGTYPQKHIGWWIWINMDKYGWIVRCNLWMIQLDLFWPTLTWLIFFKYCSDKKNHRHRTREPMITNDPGRSQLDSRADLSYPLLNLVYLSLITSSNASLLWLNMPEHGLPPNSIRHQDDQANHLSQILLHLALFFMEAVPFAHQKSGGFQWPRGPMTVGSAMFLRPLLTVILDPTHGTA